MHTNSFKLAAIYDKGLCPSVAYDAVNMPFGGI